MFELSHEGTRDIAWKASDQGLALDLGTVKVTRLILISGDKGLRQQTQKLYDSRFAENVKALLKGNLPTAVPK